MNENLTAREGMKAQIGAADALCEALSATGKYSVQCHDADGNLLWKEEIKNLVTTEGKNNLLDNHLSGAGYTAHWYIGLISSDSYSAVSADDTMANHAGWTEDIDYTQTARPTTAWSSAAAGQKTLSSGVVYTMNKAGTVKGCFLTSDSAKGGTTGVLYSAGLFTGGDQPVTSGNTLTVSYTAIV